jgi:UDP-N-acetylglucosamine--N-acetylmuramyl-(pentapeptide) pyrophosphoryl-undecaprenol N-acetylglucosamine transferase
VPSRTILIMAGGTGGHVFPALAVAAEMSSAGWHVVWLGSRNGMEASLVPQHGYAMEWIRFAGLRGKGPVRMALLPLNLLIAFWQSARVIFRVRPDVVLGMGGYVSFPGGMMARFSIGRWWCTSRTPSPGSPTGCWPRSPTAASPASRRAAQVAVVRQSVRGEIVPAACARAAFRTQRPAQVLVVGGSLRAGVERGRSTLALLDALPWRPAVIHQAGQRPGRAASQLCERRVQAQMVAFIDDMARAMRSRLGDHRAGASPFQAELPLASRRTVAFPPCGG